ncbi:hypothetical protein MNBD_ALPHA06-333 [hydrothermal vent metagenome]|uniref:TIGR02300 family protein n=1 Tax=hydrothermal vent metagenome TaxID=652676 RepID=A0A3B0STS2_9ZZZZ
MAKADLGEKRVCAECNAKFYDLNKRPVVCPKCGFSYDPDATRKTPRKPAPVPQPKETKEEADTEEADSEEESETTSDDEPELTLDDQAPLIAGNDGDDDGDSPSGSGLPDGYTEEGVEDDSDSLTDDEDEDAKLADEEVLDPSD